MMINDNISLLYSNNPKERIPLLINILEEYGIKQKKKVYLQSFDIKTSYYVNHLISLISKIDFKLIESYMFPVGEKKEELKNSLIDAKEFVFAIDVIRKSNIVINSLKIDGDFLDYIFNLLSIEPYQVIIIDNFEKFIEKSDKDIKTIRKTINCYAKKYKAEIILFMNDIEKFKNVFKNWKIAKINDSFIFEFDEKNHRVLDIREKE